MKQKAKFWNLLPWYKLAIELILKKEYCNFQFPIYNKLNVLQ